MGGQTQTPPPWLAQGGGQTWLPAGRSPRSAPTPLTVPELTYFFFLHFFLGFSTCGCRGGSDPAWGAPQTPALSPHPTSYTVNWLCALESSR